MIPSARRRLYCIDGNFDMWGCGFVNLAIFNFSKEIWIEMWFVYAVYRLRLEMGM